ncbi:MAG: hypothetical protein WBV11_12975 [Salegentibacter sp.]
MKGEEDEILLKLGEGGIICWNSKRFKASSLQQLEKYGLIDLLKNGRYHLTEKGKYAQKWGYRSFIQFEELEKQKQRTNPELRRRHNLLLLIAFFLLLIFVIGYVVAETMLAN